MLFFVSKSVFLNIFEQTRQQKVLLLYNVLRDHAPQASLQMQYYYIYIEEKHLKACQDKFISEYTPKLIKLCHFSEFSQWSMH